MNCGTMAEAEKISSDDEIMEENVSSNSHENWSRPAGTRYRSKAWNYFKLNDARSKTKCELCPTILTFPGGTSTMAKHLLHIHKIKLENSSKKRAHTPPPAQIIKPPSSTHVIKSAGARQVSINEAISR